MTLFAAASAIAWTATPGAAQTTPAPKDEPIEESKEIIVTATRRQESLQDVSGSVSALSNTQLERRGIDNFENLAPSIPGLTLNQAVKNRATFNIRGIATNVNGSNTQEPVSVYINDAPVTDTFAAAVQPDLRLFDVDRVEVLRGPQGTLFGSGSLGGTIRILTKRPDASKFEGAARIDLGVTEGGALRQRYDAMLNVPILDDQLAIRAVGYYRNEDGWVRNVTLGTRNDTVDWGGRVALLWAPGDDTSVRAEVIHQDSDPEDGDSWNPALGKFTSGAAISEGRPARFTTYNLTLEHDIEGVANLMSSTTYQQSHTGRFLDVGDLLGVGLPVLQQSSPWDSEFFTQEVRAVSNTDSPFQWVTGLFYIDRKTDINFLIRVPGLGALFGIPIPDDAFFVTDITTKSKELAIYADVSYQLTDKLKISAGARGFETKVSYSEPDRRVLNFATGGFDTVSFVNKGKDSSLTWRAALSYEPNDDTLLYASVSKGFRIGQVNANRGPSAIDPTDVVIPEAYKPDSTINYELGVKSTFADGRITANLAAFYIDWKDIQVDSVRVSDFLNFVANAGRAHSMGLELDINARPVDGLDLSLATTIQESEIDEIDPAASLQSGVVEGDRLPGGIKFKISGSAQYTWDLASDWQAYVRVDAQHVGSSTNNFSNTAGTNIPSPFFAMNEAYENVNASIGFLTEGWELVAYVENLTNDDSFIINQGGRFPNSVNTLRPRTFGGRATFKF
ncbi:TonB-dependent receptor [Sphingomonas cavernae]|uniref:TonB-dependent receptor n=1 Tax=Sphingomonas cavernae TaxID=2320861 RepID=UPI0016012781|nr:TonB-dependent receptor [Sphingomonas cavernae]